MSSWAGQPCNDDVSVSIESTAEWQINDILFDGHERYLQPEQFADHVARLARKIDWKKLVGSGSSLRGASDAVPAEGDVKRPRLTDSSTAESRDDQEVAASGTKRQAPVGPWQDVAKSLFESLTETSVLLDVLGLSRQGRYMTVEAVASDLPASAPTTPGSSARGGVDPELRAFFLAARRLNLDRAARQLRTLSMHQLSSTTSISTVGCASTPSSKDPFLNELIKLRRLYRIKKVGRRILGDLGYTIFGTKFVPGETFNIVRRWTTADQKGSASSFLDVKLPDNLSRFTTLRVRLVKDNKETDSRCGNSDQQETTRSASHLLVAELEKEDDCPTPVYPSASPLSQLMYAQKTLVNRHIFSRLAKEAVELTDRFSVVMGNQLSVSLLEDYLLCIDLCADDEMEPRQKDTTIELLETELRAMFAADLTLSGEHIGDNPSLPLTGCRSTQFAGVRALSTHQLESVSRTVEPLLVRMCRRASHLIVIKRVELAMKDFSGRQTSTRVNWNWSHVGKERSIVAIQMFVPGYENAGRWSCSVEISGGSVFVTSRDGYDSASSGTSCAQLIAPLELQMHQYQLWGSAQLAKLAGWQTLYVNAVTCTPGGVAAPTFLITDSSTTWRVKLVCELYKQPRIHTSERGKAYYELPYDNLTGDSLFMKLELLLAALLTPALP